MNLLIEFLAGVNLSKKKPRKQHIKDVLVVLEKELADFQLTVPKKKKNNNTTVC